MIPPARLERQRSKSEETNPTPLSAPHTDHTSATAETHPGIPPLSLPPRHLHYPPDKSARCKNLRQPDLRIAPLPRIAQNWMSNFLPCQMKQCSGCTRYKSKTRSTASGCALRTVRKAQSAQTPTLSSRSLPRSPHRHYSAGNSSC